MGYISVCVPLPTRALRGFKVFAALHHNCQQTTRLRPRKAPCGGSSQSSGWRSAAAVGGRVFFRIFLRKFSLFFAFCIAFFCIFVAENQLVVMGAPVFSSASAVVAFFGLPALRESLARFALAVPIGRGSSPSVRVAAACPAWAGAFVGWGLCSWFVAWRVACLVARSWGVVVGSGGVVLGSCPRSLFS